MSTNIFVVEAVIAKLSFKNLKMKICASIRNLVRNFQRIYSNLREKQIFFFSKGFILMTEASISILFRVILKKRIFSLKLSLVHGNI